jgi:hypothetical protein
MISKVVIGAAAEESLDNVQSRDSSSAAPMTDFDAALLVPVLYLVDSIFLYTRCIGNIDVCQYASVSIIDGDDQCDTN